MVTGSQTHREDQINHIHEAEDHIPNPCLIVTITSRNQSTGNEVMGQHLHMILSSLFDIHNQDLLDPECKLYKIVPLEEPGHFPYRPWNPHIRRIEPVVRVVHQVLVDA